MRWGELIKRLVLVPPTLFGVAVIVFVLLRVVPGDPIAMMIPPGASEADIGRLRALYGLDQPILQQFASWLGQVASGDFGRSISVRQSVLELLLARLPATIELALLATVVAVLLGVIAALVGILLRGRRAEWLVDGGVGMLLAIPDFLWALILLLMFGVLVPLLPISGRIDPEIELNLHSNFFLIESVLTGRFDIAFALLHHMILPALALALPFAALVARLLKASLAEAEDHDYAQIARARGYSRPNILLHEVFPNALIPTVALGGVQVTLLLGGTVLVERIFSYEGIGNMAIDAVINRDFPLIQGLVLTFAVLFIALNLVVDLVVTMLDPRLRHG
ncbi:ABC transporter permease [Bradyrhizobium sp. BR13661]|jgi:ABC-type dipeptide/oligopeptide/nickel transport system permease component|uniref:ABC transporter permease n=1 Tax=Bradyrhizobium sp. BR13661 TaxID=2940622 RepID=UPI00247431E1|nr:ABC transporter permease [Bradyrhizobium sp. BR13661]MDH6259935.1 ABC-type dipeptide/oligopeptide/nickel transport system permease component [Bradyrhizobium sp. BR13661]